jgi:DNA-binding LacI/PurR family transcriptional regulator
MKKTIHSTAELARHLGLSRWSVSRAINGQDGVSAETAEQVRAAMAEFGFAPSAHGRGLRGHRTGVIGICFRALDTPVTIEKIAHVQRLVSGRGYRPLFELTELDQRMGADVINHFISMRVEGVLFVDTPPGERSADWQRLLRRHGIPAAHLEPLGPLTHNGVHLDRVAAMAQATEHLLNLGHRHFGLFGINETSPLGEPRCDGVRQALLARGLDPARHFGIWDFPHPRPAGLRYGHELAAKLLAAPRRPTALLAVNDEVAAGVMWGLQKAGHHIPRDFSVFGFDNFVLSEQTTPALCTVDHQIEAVAAAAADLLFTLIERGPATRLPTVKIPARLIVRESAGPAPNTS